jgi:sugar (pentulose or hexulose) kinase
MSSGVQPTSADPITVTEFSGIADLKVHLETLAQASGHTSVVTAPSLDEWITVIERFVNDSVAADEFASSYFSLERQEYEASEDGQSSALPGAAGWILHDFFVKVDRLSTDARPHENGLTADELRREAEPVLTKLKQIAADPSSGPSALEKVLRLMLASIFIAGGAAAFAGYALWRVTRRLALQVGRPFRRD